MPANTSGHPSHSSNPKPNRLIKEKSPYLLQHAYNPVDWYPWGKEAIERAKKENKPIFLSIGYSSCHWCHVMEHESFEDIEIAKLLSDNFVCIKVDREERPDIDELYMKSVMSMTGSGGWPLNLFLTPTLEPFYGGTYFPPSTRYGMQSFSNVIRNVLQAWRSDRKNIINSANEIKNALREMYALKKNPELELNPEGVSNECYNALVGSFDENYGGFGDSPKFPTPSNLFFLTRYSRLNGSKLALKMATKTLDCMMRGGICDHVGGGFHRYSTDRYWLVPHFEKMLYDNALLAQAYTEAFLITKANEYALIVKETLSWALREMSSPEGGFYSAQDADSAEGEGSYYVWSKEDLRDALAKDSATTEKLEMVSKYFSITNEGNFEGGKSVLTRKSIQQIAQEYQISEQEMDGVIQLSKKLMLEHRSKRPRPPTDDKILTAWNGLMISALSKAYQALGDEQYLTSAIKAAEFILNSLCIIEGDGSGQRLLRRYRQGEAGGEGVLEDYSFLINGLIDLYEASFIPRYIEAAVSLCDSMISRFHDTDGGGFFLSARDVKDLIARAKDAYDGATPSGNSLAALTCARLGEFTGREDFREKAKDTFQAFWSLLESQPSSFTEMLVAIQFFTGKPKEVVISGVIDSQETKELVNVIRSEFLPNSILLLADIRLENLVPLVKDRIPSPAEKPKIFVCSNFVCRLPSSSSEDLMKALRES